MANSGTLEQYLEGFSLALRDAGFEADSNEKRTWNGIVSVEWTNPDTGCESVAKHNISIHLPTGFPYRAPVVISRDDPPLAPSWHLAPDPANTLCLWDSQTGWQPYFEAHQLLQRIEDWFHNYHTDDWPSNSQVPDLHRYLREKEGLVIIGDDWAPPSEDRYGRFAFFRHQHYEVLPCIASCQDRYLSARLQKVEDRLSSNLTYIEDDIERIPGIWFRLSQPFVPPDNLEDLLSNIEASLGVKQGWASKACIHIFGHKMAGEGFPIALGYVDDRSEERWLFLWAQLPEKRSKKQEVPWKAYDWQSQVRLKSFQTAPAGKKDLLRRSTYLSEHLASHRVVIFGVGALGGSVALLLAKAGIGTISLVDDDILLPGNVMRHVCGLKQVGFKKTKAVKYCIHRHNPDCDVICHEKTWKAEELGDYIESCDVVVDATANRRFSLYLNEICIKCNQPVLFATAYRRASIGRVIVRRGNQDPCLACYYADAKRFWTEDEYPLIPEAPEGTFIEDGCGAVTEEAVALDVEAVANLAARTAIRIIQKQLGSDNLAILVSESLPDVSGILAQQGIHWLSNEPLQECLICHG